jgi:hypothetical protein
MIRISRLRDELREFVEERVQIEKGMDTEDDEVNDEIERRRECVRIVKSSR